jgi:hypothetical protein
MVGFGKRVSYAFRSFFALLGSGTIPPDIVREVVELPAPEPAPAPLPPPKPAAESADRALQMLAILQRDGRLIDFLTEDISSYADGQVGAAVRAVHEDCRKVLERYLSLEPIIASDEGEPVTVEGGFDPAAIKLIGNVRGSAPMRGLLRHRGWRVTQVSLPPLPDGDGRSVIAPAEVEIP